MVVGTFTAYLYSTLCSPNVAWFAIAKHESMLIEIQHERDNEGGGEPSPFNAPAIRHSRAQC